MGLGDDEGVSLARYLGRLTKSRVTSCKVGCICSMKHWLAILTWKKRLQSFETLGFARQFTLRDADELRLAQECQEGVKGREKEEQKQTVVV